MYFESFPIHLYSPLHHNPCLNKEIILKLLIFKLQGPLDISLFTSLDFSTNVQWQYQYHELLTLVLQLQIRKIVIKFLKSSYRLKQLVTIWPEMQGWSQQIQPSSRPSLVQGRLGPTQDFLIKLLEMKNMTNYKSCCWERGAGFHTSGMMNNFYLFTIFPSFINGY